VTTTPARFLIPRPEDSDAPDGPSEFNAALDVVDTRLRYAGAQGGKSSIISGSQSRTNVAYGKLGTPDQVSSLVLPADGLILVAFQAVWAESVAGAGRAAIFLDGTAGGGSSNQLKIANVRSSGNPVTQAAATNEGTGVTDHPLFTFVGGLASGVGNGAYGADVTTGQVLGGHAPTTALAQEVNGTVESIGAAPSSVGGPVMIFAAAGTYDISVQVKSSSGSVTMHDRHLWAWTKEFPSSGI
jgi:hypothetical protein